MYERLESAPDPAQDRAVDALAAAGHPVVRIAVTDVYDLGAEFFRWEIATAVAGSILGINPFNQPDVEASKIATKKLTIAFEEYRLAAAGNPALKKRHQGVRTPIRQDAGDACARTLNRSTPATISRCWPISR